MWRIIQVLGIVIMLAGSVKCFTENPREIRSPASNGIAWFCGGLVAVLAGTKMLKSQGRDPGLRVKD
jgi:hypothetical protein